MIDNAEGNTFYYHFDGLGSVVALSDVNSVIVERYSYSYDVFGKPSNTSDVNNPYLFTGRRYDPEAGLYYYRARYYDYYLGRFLQPDLIGYDDGLNLYTYCGNNPLNWIDPWGLCKDEPWYKRAWDKWYKIVWGTSVKLGFDAEFFDRFDREVDRNRLPLADWFSFIPMSPLAPAGPASTLVGAGAEKMAINEATRKVTTFSPSRSFVYISNYKPVYFRIAKSIKNAGRVFTGVSVFYTGADIGTIIYSAFKAYGD
jgi:RHS repeat-associated protein